MVATWVGALREEELAIPVIRIATQAITPIIIQGKKQIQRPTNAETI